MYIGLRFMVLILSIFFWRPAFSLSATENAPLSGSGCASFEELKAEYLKNNQYNEFIDALNNSKGKLKLTPSCINYYKALARYSQLKYLEEKQLWDDYFANGNTYRDQIIQFSKNVIDQTSASDRLRVQSRLLLWKFHRDQQDAFHEQALIDLIADVNAYAKETNDAVLIKDIADELKGYEEKTKARELYKLYVDKLVSGQMIESKLKAVAAGFYKEGNLELAEIIYDIYIEKTSKALTPEKFIPELFEIASMFVYKSPGLYDMAYAEKIYARIEGLGKQDVFNQGAIYLRAFNLEKMQEYKKAREFYLRLIQLYADTRYFDEAVYKIAMIDAYALADVKEARIYFEKLTSKPIISPQVTTSFYQLGLLAQWEGDLVKAKDYYGALIKNSADTQAAVVALAQDRLKEIEENKPLNYNLKIFLDLSFKQESNLLEMNRAELKSSYYILEKNQKTSISSMVLMPESGCNQIELQYLWSGNLGEVHPGTSDGGFQGSYADPGTKEINIVIVSPAGALDRSFIMMDVY